MGDPQAIQKAQYAVAKILDILGVVRVVCVDDMYTHMPQVEDVITAACTIERDALRELLPELAETISDDQDVLNSQIRDLWGRIDDKARAARAGKILTVARLQDNEAADDLGDASILGELIAKEKLVTLSPTQWDQRRDELLKEDAECRTLFLFDQDFSPAGGDSQGGIRIIASLLARDDTLICGLLTHTVTPENQPEAWAELSRMHNLPPDRFLVVPKQHFSRDPVVFAQILKLVALSPDFSEMKKKAKKIIADSAKAADDRVDNIHIHDLDHIVFGVSAKEGLWEPDMLFRLHALYHRLEARRLAHEGGELEAIAKRLRSVSHIPTETAFRLASSTWQIQHDELYESTDHLNKSHLPLDIGDIFVKTGEDTNKYYILLAQPCDLMVRLDGERHPDLVHVPLATVARTSDSELPKYADEMPYFVEEPGGLWVVKLKQTYQIRVCVLDLCVFDDDGKAVIQLPGKAPEGIRPTWQARYEVLVEVFRRKLRPLDHLSPENGESLDVRKTKDSLRTKLGAELLREELFKGEATEMNGVRSIVYNCRRIGRLSRARAFGLIMGYTSCLSRPAYDPGFVSKP